MAIKKILDDFQNALSIAQAGIKATVSALRDPKAKPKKRRTRKLTPRPKLKARTKKKSPAAIEESPTPKRKRTTAKMPRKKK